jgi:hypothetical protein
MLLSIAYFVLGRLLRALAPSAGSDWLATDLWIRGFARDGCATHNGKVQVERLAPRTLGLVGPVLAQDADQLLEAIASLGPGGPITLNLAEVTSIDEGGMAAIRQAATRRTTSEGC